MRTPCNFSTKNAQNLKIDHRMRSYQKAFLCYVQAAKVSLQCRTAIHFMTLETFYDWVCNMYNFVLSVLYAIQCFSSPIVNYAKVHTFLP